MRDLLSYEIPLDKVGKSKARQHPFSKSFNDIGIKYHRFLEAKEISKIKLGLIQEIQNIFHNFYFINFTGDKICVDLRFE
jgi:hypothetical protein